MTATRSDFVVDSDVVERSLARAPDTGHAFRVRFGTAAVDVRALSAQRLAVVEKRLHTLCTAEPASITLDVVDALDGFRAIDTRNWENTFAPEHADDRIVVVGRDFCSVVDVDTLHAKLACTKHDDDFIAPLENTLRVVAAYRCLSRGGALFHAASIVDDDGSVRICFGHSGAGKSTLAGNWLRRGRAVLGDELCAVELVDDEFVVEQLPFAGDLAVPSVPAQQFALRGLHRIHQGALSSLPMPRTAAIASLTACAPFVNIDPHRAPQLLDNLAALVRACPPTKLTLGIDDDPRALWASTCGTSEAA